MQKIGNIIAFQSTTPPPPSEPRPASGSAAARLLEEENFSCPTVVIVDGGAAIRAQSGPDSGSLRHQIAILNIARECTPTGNGGYRLKLGVEGRVVLGPAGSAGSYFASLETRVMRGDAVVARRVSRVGATIAAGQAGNSFVQIDDGIIVPAGGETEILIGLSPGGGATPARSRRRR